MQSDLQLDSAGQPGFRTSSLVICACSAGTPSAQPDGNAAVAVIRKEDIKNAKKAAKAAQKAIEFNKAFGGQTETIV